MGMFFGLEGVHLAPLNKSPFIFFAVFSNLVQIYLTVGKKECIASVSCCMCKFLSVSIYLSLMSREGICSADKHGLNSQYPAEKFHNFKNSGEKTHLPETNKKNLLYLDQSVTDPAISLAEAFALSLHFSSPPSPSPEYSSPTDATT